MTWVEYEQQRPENLSVSVSFLISTSQNQPYYHILAREHLGEATGATASSGKIVKEAIFFNLLKYKIIYAYIVAILIHTYIQIVYVLICF